jgi:hypothetical protein
MAIAHQMLKIVFVMLTQNQPYRDPDVDYEKLVISRNAARWIKALDTYGYLKKQKEVAA